MTKETKIKLATEETINSGNSADNSVDNGNNALETPVITIAKPSTFSLDKFKSKTAPQLANVEVLLTALPHFKIKEANDYCRTHPDEEAYWSQELCFVQVPIVGQRRDTLHLIEELLALRYLPSAKIIRHRLALASKPHDVFFLCHVPSQNLDNSYNQTSLIGCEEAKRKWLQVTSRRLEGVDSYKITYAQDQDAFPNVKWPTQRLEQLIEVTFANRMIDREDHPAMLRLLGAKQQIT